jgi:hypothetical protein
MKPRAIQAVHARSGGACLIASDQPGGPEDWPSPPAQIRCASRATVELLEVIDRLYIPNIPNRNIDAG